MRIRSVSTKLIIVMEQYEYYQQQKLHPDRVALKGNDNSKIDGYTDVRRNLYQKLLNLPLAWLDNEEILEVGCGTGESSLVFAKYGAYVTLVDADSTVFDPQEQLFERFFLQHKVRRRVVSTVEEYLDEEKYSLVTAEGWLFTLSNRAEILKKLGSFVSPGGYLVVSYPDSFGSFLEFIKKFVLWRAYQIGGVGDIYSERALTIAENLLGPGYQKLASSRPFKVWWADCMVSPFLRIKDTWNCVDILSELRMTDLEYYSSTPRIFEYNHLSWYKELDAKRHELFASVTNSYSVRKYDMLFGESVNLNLSRNSLAKLDNEVLHILGELSAYFEDINASLPDISFSSCTGILESGGYSGAIVNEIKNCFDLVKHGDDVDSFINQYLSFENLASRWGSSYNYICLAKDIVV